MIATSDIICVKRFDARAVVFARYAGDNLAHPGSPPLSLTRAGDRRAIRVRIGIFEKYTEIVIVCLKFEACSRYVVSGEFMERRWTVTTEAGAPQPGPQRADWAWTRATEEFARLARD